MLRIETKKINELHPAAYNPRKDLQPGDEEYEKIRRSIDEFGLVDPIVWNESTGNIVGGHQRYKVLVDMGYTEVDVSVVSLDMDREKALNVALNKISGEFDRDKLTLLLDELNNSMIDVELTGFGMDELADLLSVYNDVDEIEEESHYTDKIRAPEYEPKELEAPPIKRLFNDEKANYLIYDIERSNIAKEMKEFLKLAAMRHVVFDYSQIAEYYAHADAATQELMEQSALVIIDYNKAIAYGFTELASLTLENEMNQGALDDEEA